MSPAVPTSSGRSGSVLNKEGRLTLDERREMERHWKSASEFV